MWGDITPKNGIDISWVKIVENPAKFGHAMELCAAQYLKNVLPDFVRVEHTPFSYGTDIALIDNRTGEKIRVEVKAARRGLDGKFRATIAKKSRGYLAPVSDFILFVCVENSTLASVFVLPASAYAGKSFICVTSSPATYTGKCAGFLGRINQILERF